MVTEGDGLSELLLLLGRSRWEVGGEVGWCRGGGRWEGGDEVEGGRVEVRGKEEQEVVKGKRAMKVL